MKLQEIVNLKPGDVVCTRAEFSINSMQIVLKNCNVKGEVTAINYYDDRLFIDTEEQTYYTGQHTRLIPLEELKEYSQVLVDTWKLIGEGHVVVHDLIRQLDYIKDAN